MTNDITYVADLIDGDPEVLIPALKTLINNDVAVAPCIVPDALRYAHILLEHYAICMTQVMLPPQFRKWKQIDVDYCEKVLKVAQELLLVSAAGWDAIMD